jgi:hypothetical protein
VSALAFRDVALSALLTRCKLSVNSSIGGPDAVKYGKEEDRRMWIKVHLMCGVKTNIERQSKSATAMQTITVSSSRYSKRPLAMGSH